MTVAKRLIVAALSISAAGFAAWQTNEGFTSQAVIPTKGDVPTIGHGNTFYEDGRKVQMGDTITRKRAEELARNILGQKSSQFAATLPPPATLTQGEFDAYLDFVGQYGIGNWRGSTMRREVIAGRYIQACNAMLRYKYAAGYDCSTPGNKRCYGVWTRQQARVAKCVAAASE